MNYVKIAAALHALADAFVESFVEDSEDKPVKPSKSKKVAPAEPTVVAAGTNYAAAMAPVIPEPEPAPAAPPITKDQLNKAVLKVAAKSRDTAEAVLKRFGAVNTVTLPQDKWQAVYDAFEEEIAKIDAAAVQVAQASLV